MSPDLPIKASACVGCLCLYTGYSHMINLDISNLVPMDVILPSSWDLKKKPLTIFCHIFSVRREILLLVVCFAGLLVSCFFFMFSCVCVCVFVCVRMRADTLYLQYLKPVSVVALQVKTTLPMDVPLVLFFFHWCFFQQKKPQKLKKGRKAGEDGEGLEGHEALLSKTSTGLPAPLWSARQLAPVQLPAPSQI